MIVNAERWSILTVMDCSSWSTGRPNSTIDDDRAALQQPTTTAKFGRTKNWIISNGPGIINSDQLNTLQMSRRLGRVSIFWHQFLVNFARMYPILNDFSRFVHLENGTEVVWPAGWRRRPTSRQHQIWSTPSKTRCQIFALWYIVANYRIRQLIRAV